MPSASAVNEYLDSAVQHTRDQYRGFTQALRGLCAETLTGLANGTASFLGVTRGLEQLHVATLHTMRQHIEDVVRQAALNAYDSAAEFDSTLNTDKTLAVAESLTAGFAAHLVALLDTQMQRDVRQADNFVRTQLTQGRFFATTEELSVDLAFKHTDRGGRQIDSADYIQREVNWSLRQHHNTVLIYALSTAGHEEARVEGGSKSGQVVRLDDYDKVGPTIFHHNSKATLHPNYSVS